MKDVVRHIIYPAGGSEPRCLGFFPERDEIPLPVPIEERLIIEFYS